MIAEFIVPTCGDLPYTLTNDYLFKMVLQRNNNVLKGLVRDCLQLQNEDIKTVRITNPIRLADSIDGKTTIADIEAIMNDNAIVNIEMQVINESDWCQRSLYYLCEDYVNLNKGDLYVQTKPVYQIGILDYTLFKKRPEFYASYRFMNVKNHRIYSDNLQLYVLDLTQIELATEDDKAHNLHTWAALFKSKTWEDLRMFANDISMMDDVTKTVYEVTADERARQLLRHREDQRKREAGRAFLQAQAEKNMEEAQKALAEKDAEIAELKRQLEEAKSNK